MSITCNFDLRCFLPSHVLIYTEELKEKGPEKKRVPRRLAEVQQAGDGDQDEGQGRLGALAVVVVDGRLDGGAGRGGRASRRGYMGCETG